MTCTMRNWGGGGGPRRRRRPISQQQQDTSSSSYFQSTFVANPDQYSNKPEEENWGPELFLTPVTPDFRSSLPCIHSSSNNTVYTNTYNSSSSKSLFLHDRDRSNGSNTNKNNASNSSSSNNTDEDNNNMRDDVASVGRNRRRNGGCRVSPTTSSSPTHTKAMMKEFPSMQHQQIMRTPFGIPVSEIVMIRTANSNCGGIVPLHTTTMNIGGRRRNGSNEQINAADRTRLCIATYTMGNFSFDCLSANGHDILLTFLQASLLPDRILYDCLATITTTHNENDNPVTVVNTSNNLHQHHYDMVTSLPTTTQRTAATGTIPKIESSSSSVSTCGLDIDALHAHHLQGRAEAETWPEKLSRRVGLVFNNLSQAGFLSWTKNPDGTPTNTNTSSSFCCGEICWTGSPNSSPANPFPERHDTDPSSTATPTNSSTRVRNLLQQEERRLYMHHLHHPNDFSQLEIDDSTTDGSIKPPLVGGGRGHLKPNNDPRSVTPAKENMNNLHLHRSIVRMPSGLSVEPDPDLVLHS